MTKSFLVFPTGSSGGALVVLRIALALALAASAQMHFPDWLAIGAIILAVMILGGVFTRFAAVLGAVFSAIFWLKIGGSLGSAAALLGLCAIALAMLGAGGYSIDARLFGRRVIDLDRPNG
jgi:uncharacterized membrane protein YphA (DoxX/SURF4 family)